MRRIMTGCIVGVTGSLPAALVALLLTRSTAPEALLDGLVVAVTACLGIGFAREWTRARSSGRRSLHDRLTGLPNEDLLVDRAEQTLLLAGREGAKVAMLRVDFDRFREVNDLVGHGRGDEVLRQTSERLTALLRKSDTTARLDADEFGILLARVADIADAQMVAAKVLHALDEPFAIDGLTLTVEASVGVAVFPDHADDVDGLLARAEAALRSAKAEHGGYAVYRPERDPANEGRGALVDELQAAVAAGDLRIHYQPKADLRTGRVVGAEAIVRWPHPTRGLLEPDDFLPIAKRAGLARPIALAALDQSLRECHQWQQAGHEVGVSVNLSARNLLDLDLPEDIARLLVAREVAPQWLQLEIPEATIMADPVRALEVVFKLRRIGVELAVDQFGSGFSSLAFLKRLPINELKIDRSFVTRFLEDESDLAIIRSAVELAHNLRLRAVAEGVETVAAWGELARLGCDLGQGHVLARPMPGPEFGAWLDARMRVAPAAYVDRPTASW